jgi:hypothetical protein
MKTIADYLPREEERILIQFKCPKELHRDAYKRVRDLHVNWSDYLRALVARDIDESRKKRRENCKLHRLKSRSF